MTTVLIMLCVVSAMFLVEKWWPANQLPKVKKWWPRVLLTNFAQAGIVILLGGSWDILMDHTASIQPWSLRKHVGIIPQIGIGYISITFIYYWWHRIRHNSPFFWRLCHQLHHSPRRMEVLMSFYKHPVEILINGLLSSIITFVILGCSTEAAALVTLATGVAELFYHWNIKTPRWIGPFFQRPESHRVHHQRNHHTHNYSDIPLWDMLFGTYQNPKKLVRKCGFDAAKESQFKDMLSFDDVHQTADTQQPLLHLLPTCIGCSKRWACHQSRTEKIDTM